ncbi:MAG TPA: HD domain-containing phosphohydrolase [Terriglobia bacterium]|jgi:response regulator RpfG family c-di-GMP phosphodiesterase
MERVLVVDDEKDCRYALADALRAKGFNAEIAENGREALAVLESQPSTYGLVYSDMRMPELGGIELVENLAGLDPTIVAVLLTGQADPRSPVAAMRAGAFDFLSKPFTMSELEISLARATERRHMLVRHENDRAGLRNLLDTSEAEKKRLVTRHEEERQKIFVSSIRAHARSIEAKDSYTAAHCDRVERYAEIIARHHGGFDENWIFNLKVGAILHDIGKIGIRSSILCKPGALDALEYDEIRAHPVIGGRIVRSLGGLNLEPIVRHHHEHFDGTGYPWGLKGDAIPLESRIVLIADTFDAMTSDRPYRRCMNTDLALAELENHAGAQFDPYMVRVALDAAPQLDAARLEHSENGKREYFSSSF